MKKILPFLLVSLFLIISCANPGTPDGGPYDETAPSVIGVLPMKGTIGKPGASTKIFFSELIKLENAAEKVVVSPPQLNMPEIASYGKYIKVKLEDTLRENTTYTIDFSDAIVDNNENNPMGNYTYVFSTGETIDTMEVSGTVLNAENLEPVKGILVGLHSDTIDSVFFKKPFVRVARTDSRGHFVIRGVANGTYRIFALADADDNYLYSQKSEMIAFQKATITTGSYPDIRMDTIWHDSIYYDSIKAVPYTHFTPDNIVLCAYNSKLADRHLLKTERAESEHFDVFFTAPSTELPIIKGLNFNEKDAFHINFNEGKDTLQYWINDTLLIYQDTLELEMRYLESDSAGLLVERIDTLEMVSKVAHEKKVKWEKDAYKKWEKEQKKLAKKNQPYQTTYPIPSLELDFQQKSSLAPNENLDFHFKEPLASIDTSKIHLLLQKDTLWVEAPYLFKQLGSSIMSYRLFGEWRPNQQYILQIDSAAFTGIYGHVSNEINCKFKIPTLDQYGTLMVNLIGMDDTLSIVQLMNSDKPIQSVRCKDGHADFFFIKPGNYYLRMFRDTNGNFRWDEGDYGKNLLPEETYYFPGSINVRANWDVTQDWNPTQIPLNKQKPLEITKQKPDKDKVIQNRNADREREKRNR